jgi:glycosyltransferase involved in cell wall biosynthesis
VSRFRVSFVVIGRNEARHLAESIASCTRQGLDRDEIEIIYVDSGSTDGSREIAREAGVDRILELGSTGASAARARNLGLTNVDAEFVQFVDADTKLAPGWVADGIAALEADPRLAGAEGDLREVRPVANLYHAVCELDWPSSPGEVPYVSGNSLYRVRAIGEAEGFDPRMKLGEEPELGARLRRANWRFVHLDRTMGHHDLDMNGFGDWLRRGYRSGLACAMVVRATGGWGRGFWHERMRRTLTQCAVLVTPWLLAIAALPFSPTSSLAAFALGCLMIAALAVRKAVSLSRDALPLRTRIAFGFHTYLVKIPSSLGILSALIRRLPGP